MTAAYPLADIGLARRLELAEALSNVAFVESRARLQPQSGAGWLERAGARAMFDGTASPLTQTFALGMFADPADGDLEAIEQFFDKRGADVFHEVSPLAGDATIGLLNARRYEPFEFSSVMFQPVGTGERPPADPGVRVRIASSSDDGIYTETATRGWSETPGLAEFLREIGTISGGAEGTVRFIAELDGRPAGTGVLGMYEGVAIFAGASTAPESRNRGVQLALLAARMEHAASSGCDLAMMVAQPGSGSQRNAERRGFRIAYTRIKWRRRE